MDIHEFIRNYSSADNPIGDLAKDILRDKNFPSSKSETEILDYLDIETKKGGINDIFQEFVAAYRRETNTTFKLILNFLKEKKITSIEDAIDKGIAIKFIESCGYKIKIPFGGSLTDSISDDLRKLETINVKYMSISNGDEIYSSMIMNSEIIDGKTIGFCCQKFQFNFMLSFVK